MWNIGNILEYFGISGDVYTEYRSGPPLDWAVDWTGHSPGQRGLLVVGLVGAAVHPMPRRGPAIYNKRQTLRSEREPGHTSTSALSLTVLFSCVSAQLVYTRPLSTFILVFMVEVRGAEYRLVLSKRRNSPVRTGTQTLVYTFGKTFANFLDHTEVIDVNMRNRWQILTKQKSIINSNFLVILQPTVELLPPPGQF